jgi:hypothetical protein
MVRSTAAVSVCSEIFSNKCDLLFSFFPITIQFLGALSTNVTGRVRALSFETVQKLTQF